MPHRSAISRGAVWAAPLLAGLLGAGCGRDPILDRADQLSEEQERTAPQPGAAPTPGKPTEPVPVKPADPEPVKPDGPPPPEAEARVKLTGRVTLAGGSATGIVHIDAFDGDQLAAARTGQHPSVVALTRLDGPGHYTLRVPTKAGRVWVGAYLDTDGDGKPGPAEPAGWYAKNPVMTDADHDAIDIVLRVPSSDDR